MILICTILFGDGYLNNCKDNLFVNNSISMPRKRSVQDIGQGMALTVTIMHSIFRLIVAL